MQTCCGTSIKIVSRLLYKVNGQAIVRRTDYLDLYIDLDELLTQGVDLDETGINRTVESAEFGHETDIALFDGLVGVWADAATRDGAEAAKS